MRENLLDSEKECRPGAEKEPGKRPVYPAWTHTGGGEGQVGEGQVGEGQVGEGQVGEGQVLCTHTWPRAAG